MKTGRRVIHVARVASALDLRLMRTSARLGWRAALICSRLGLVRSRDARARSGRRLATPSLTALSGAGAMYFLDPQRGGQRRAAARNRFRRARA